MTAQEYLTDRVNDQIEWYDKKSQFNQTRFKFIRVLNIILSVSIPFLTALMNDDKNTGHLLKIIIGFIGALIAISEAILNLYKYHENWIQYRGTTESLKHHKYLFETKTGIYANETNAFAALVDNVENLISKENTTWVGNNQAGKTLPQPS
jgi:uncharacterized membrane protein YeaQ/YmgE (transglycosylase-associated protein family)